MIYLDNAATGFPKPHTVTDEVNRCLTGYCGNPGRGSHQLSLAAMNAIYECRELVSKLIGLNAPERVVFTLNTTHALNLAVKGMLNEGEHVLISEFEHNAVRRPLAALAAKGKITYDIYPVLGLSAEEVVAGIAARKKPNTKLVIATHASNICSLSLPIAQIGAWCRKEGILFLVDAAQSAGHLPIDMRAMHIDALAAPGHKGLYGIQGCGFLALGEGVTLHTLMEGGSGVDSLPPEMPSFPPERYEAGTLPTPAIVGLAEGIRFLKRYGVEAVAGAERQLFLAAKDRLSSLPHIKLYAADHVGAVLLFSKENTYAGAVAEECNRHGICVRGGYHCAPLAHEALHTPSGGAVRVSFGLFNTLRDVDCLWRALL